MTIPAIMFPNPGATGLIPSYVAEVMDSLIDPAQHPANPPVKASLMIKLAASDALS